jgi:hypothetical protein
MNMQRTNDKDVGRERTSSTISANSSAVGAVVWIVVGKFSKRITE